MQRFPERFFLLDFFLKDIFRVWHTAALGDIAPEETPVFHFQAATKDSVLGASSNLSISRLS